MKVGWSYFLTRWYTKRKRYIMNVNEAVIIARIMTFRYYVTWEKQCSHKSWHYDGSYHDVVVQENLPLLLAICRQSRIKRYITRFQRWNDTCTIDWVLYKNELFIWARSDPQLGKLLWDRTIWKELSTIIHLTAHRRVNPWVINDHKWISRVKVTLK